MNHSAGGAEVEVLVRGARTILRRPGASDEQEYSRLRRASAEFHAPWEPTPPAGVDPHGKLMFLHFLEGSHDARRERLLLCRAEDGEILGGINLNEIVRGAFQSAYLGYWIGAPHARQGFMREGLELALGHAFDGLGMHRLEANIRPENSSSIALVRGAGFRREGYSPGYLEIAGAWRDHERWAFLREQWHARRA